MRGVAFAGVAACLIGVIACASSKTHLLPPDVPADTGRGDSTQATVTVENQRFADMDIYVVGQDGIRIRLGMVHGHATAEFVIPKYLLLTPVNDLRFVADPINGQSAGISETMSVSPGDDIVMTIPPN